MSSPAKRAPCTGVERFFSEGEFIVSKTDMKGKITYTNRVFMDIAGYKESELLGQPHNIIRNPQMPRAIFKLLWDTIQSGEEIFAYVVNSCKNGDHYWVFAHVTPSFDKDGRIVGYHSNRRVPCRTALDEVIVPLYKELLKEEEKFNNKKEGMASSYQMLNSVLKEKGLKYEEFVFAISRYGS